MIKNPKVKAQERAIAITQYNKDSMETLYALERELKGHNN